MVLSIKNILVGLIVIAFSKLSIAADYPFHLEQINDSKSIAFNAVNAGVVPVQVTLSVARVDSSVLKNNPLISTVVPAKSKVRLVAPPMPASSVGIVFDYQWQIGQPDAVHDANALYRLPYEEGKSFRITQAPDAHSFTHNEADSLNAIDFEMPVGTSVVAARAGYVISVDDSWGEGSNDRSYANKANTIRILHSDGTWAVYGHLQKNSAVVKPGQAVIAGQQIALSGNSGYSTGPHLHFAVLKNNGKYCMSIPFKFYTSPRGPFVAKMGEHIAAKYEPKPNALEALASSQY